MKLNARFLILFLLTSLSANQAAWAQRVATDFDSDGLSDFVWVESSDSGLVWKALKSSDQSTAELGTLGTLGDNLCLADWAGTGAPQLASVKNVNGQVSWTLDAGDSNVEAVFGESGGTAVTGGDYNNDGKADAAYVTRVGKRMKWSIRYNLFGDATETAQELFFGRSADAFFFASPDGQGDWIGTIRQRGRRSFVIRMKNVVSGTLRRFSGQGAFSIGKPKAKPLPIRKESGIDSLFVAKESGENTVVSFFDLETSAMSTATFTGTGTAVVGNFSAAPGEEFALVRETETNVYNPFSAESSTAAGISGIAVDEINLNLIEGEDDGGGDDGEDDRPPVTVPPGGLGDVCASYTTILNFQMLIKSEISDHINPNDPRATGYTLVCGSQCTANLNRSDFFYADGSYAGSVGYYGRFAGNRQPRLYGAAGGAEQHFARLIAARARTIGNGKLYMQVSRDRTGPNTACKEFNPTGRNGDA